MPLITAKSTVRLEQQERLNKELFVSEEAQQRLSEILADSPKTQDFAGTVWQITPLRFGTQFLIAKELGDLEISEKSVYQDALRGLMQQIPTLCRIITLMLLNDKELIFVDGNPRRGFSDTFQKTFDTVMWEAESSQLTPLVVDCLKMLDVSFFMEALGMLQIFRANTTEKKRTRKKIQKQK